MTQQYDLVVIGTGTGASVAADCCRAAGWRVAIIDQLPFGGTCALCGCDPKKVWVGAAEVKKLSTMFAEFAVMASWVASRPSRGTNSSGLSAASQSLCRR